MCQKRHFPDRDDENDDGAGAVAVSSNFSKYELRQKRHFYDSDTDPRKKPRSDVEHHTYNNCKILNIVSHGKRIGKSTKQQLLDWFNESDTGSDNDDSTPHKTSPQIEAHSDPEIEKVLNTIDLTKIEEDYWAAKHKKMTPRQVNTANYSAQKRTPPKNPYKK